MSKTFQGLYRPTHPEKYINPRGLNNICFRSSWEKSLMIFLDRNEHIVKWGSEEIAIPYILETDGKLHRYFVDFYIEFDNGKKVLVEVKPFSQTQKPTNNSKKRKKTILNETFTYIKNVCKWKAAKQFAEKNGMDFQIWTENELQKIGINLITSKKFRYVNSKKTNQKTCNLKS